MMFYWTLMHKGGKIDLLDFKGFMQTKQLQFDQNYNEGPYYQHMVSTGNAAFFGMEDV